MKWIKKIGKEFEKDDLRIKYSEVNWDYLKPSIKKVLDTLANELKQNGIDVFTYDYATESKDIGFDGLNLQFANTLTGNVRRIVNYKNNEVQLIENKVHFQFGSVLAITYNATGAINIMIFPSKSEDSLAKHTYIILHHTYNARTITDKRIEKYVKAFIRYHRYTGVLHRVTLADKLIIRWLKTRMFWIQYLNPNEKFKRYSGIYIPTLSLLVSLTAAITSIIALFLTLKHN